MSTKDALAVGAQVLVWQVVLFLVGANTIGVFVFMVGHQRGPLSPSSELAFLLGWAAIFALQGFAPQIVSKLSSPNQQAFARTHRAWFAVAAFAGPWLGVWVVRQFTTQQWWLQLGESGIAIILMLVVASTLLCTLGTALWRHFRSTRT